MIYLSTFVWRFPHSVHLKILYFVGIIYSMGRRKKDSGTRLKAAAFFVLFCCMAGLIVFKTGILTGGDAPGQGLAGTVAVKGTVKVEDLNLSKSEVSKINRAVADHRDTFSQVDLFLDVKDGRRTIDANTVLIWAMVLETDGDCEVRSWSRKISRSDLVAQMILYMNKAAKEYEQFKKYPDVKQNFKCLYI
jgi:hypothetical protein